MFRRRGRIKLWRVITIRVDHRGPPAGEVVVDDGPPMPFAGWLQLLAILAAALPEEPASWRSAQGLGGELDP